MTKSKGVGRTGRPKKVVDPSVNSNTSTSVNSTDSTAAPAPAPGSPEMIAQLSTEMLAPEITIARSGTLGKLFDYHTALQKSDLQAALDQARAELKELKAPLTEAQAKVTTLTRQADGMKVEIDRLTKTNTTLQAWKDSGLTGLRKLAEIETDWLRETVSRLRAYKDDIIRGRISQAESELSLQNTLLEEVVAYMEMYNITHQIDASAVEKRTERARYQGEIKELNQRIAHLRIQLTTPEPAMPPLPEMPETPEMPTPETAPEPSADPSAATADPIERNAREILHPPITDEEWAAERKRISANPDATSFIKQKFGLMEKQPSQILVDVEVMRQREGLSSVPKSKPVVFEKRRFDQSKTRH